METNRDSTTSADLELRAGCLPPRQPAVTEADRDHPRYPEYAQYLRAMSRQLVTGCTFARWLADTERDEQGFSTVFEVTSPGALLAPGWWRNDFGPGHKLIAQHGPFASEDLAECAGGAR